jgi:predicted Zn-dependent peptidase
MITDHTQLPNGLRVVSHHMPHLETVSMGMWIGVGARHETSAVKRHHRLLRSLTGKILRRIE